MTMANKLFALLCLLHLRANLFGVSPLNVLQCFHYLCVIPLAAS
jgi:hypothetical protein